MIVIMIAITPSLNASNRPVLIWSSYVLLVSRQPDRRTYGPPLWRYGSRFRSIRRNTLTDPATDSAAAIHNSARYPPTKDSAIALRASEFVVCIAASLGLWTSIC